MLCAYGDAPALRALLNLLDYVGIDYCLTNYGDILQRKGG